MNESNKIVIRVTTNEPAQLRRELTESYPDADLTAISSMAGAETVFLIGLSVAGSLASIAGLVYTLRAKPKKNSQITIVYIQNSSGDILVSTDKFTDESIAELLSNKSNDK